MKITTANFFNNTFPRFVHEKTLPYDTVNSNEILSKSPALRNAILIS